MANISKVYLLNTPLEDDMKNTLYFASASAQKSYMDNNVLKTYTNVSYQRDTSTFRCPAQIDTIRNCNYIMYQNSAYSNKWFYGFIKKMTYINDGMTDVEFEIDPIQTFMFDITVRPSFVEREHTNDDTVGSNTIPEQLEMGEYVIADSSQAFVYNAVYCYIAIGATKLPSTFVNPTMSGTVLPEGLYYVAVKNNGDLKKAIKTFDDDGKGDAIQSVFIVPQECFPQDGWTTTALRPENFDYSCKPTTMFFSLDEDVNFNTRLAGSYSPRNNKLKTYPFCYLQMSNNAGGIANYRYEDFNNQSSGTFNFRYSMCAGGDARVYPKNYKGKERNFDEGINFGKLPVGSWSTDVYTNWLTQNGVNMAVGFVSDVASVAVGVATAPAGGGTGIVSGVTGIASKIGQIYEHSKQPPQAEGNIANGDVNYIYSMTGIVFMKKSIKPEYLRIADDYLDMFGYATHRVKTPNTAHRQNWWYTKTIDCNIIGDVPNDYMNQIKQAYNSGITFWRNPSNFLNYSVSNGIV